MARIGTEDNIKTYLEETGLQGMDWVKVAQDRDKRWVLERGNKS